MSRERTKQVGWMHQEGDIYRAFGLNAYCVNGGPTSFEISCAAEKKYVHYRAALDSGFQELDRSDDFNVAVKRGENVFGVLWGPDARVVEIVVPGSEYEEQIKELFDE